MGLHPIVLIPRSDEDLESLEDHQAGEPPEVYVCRVANAKLEHAIQRLYRSDRIQQPKPGDLIIAADTVVSLHGQILGKPAHDQAARAMLRQLSNTTHDVLTAVSLSRFDQTAADRVLVRSEVTFAALSPQWIEAYIASGEPFDKAGGYGIQGAAGSLIPHITGSFSGIMGLPLYETLDLIHRVSRHGQPRAD